QSKNKSRSLKSFMSKAEVALWFSKSFGLEISSLYVEEQKTGVKHVIQLPNNEKEKKTEKTGEEQNMSKYSTLSDNERERIEEILYLLDKFCVGECFYHELSMLNKTLPRWALFILPASILVTLCFLIFALFETTDQYKYVHSVGHVFLGIGIALLLPNHRHRISHYDVSRQLSDEARAQSVNSRSPLLVGRVRHV
ncbi:hypothetical protein AC249_AIPGENE17995, partial [Exaiptasia diaphana]